MPVTTRVFSSVRARITFLATVVVAALLVGASLGLLAVLDHELTQQSDAVLRARALELADLAVAGDLGRAPPTIGDEGLVQVVDDRGAVLAASTNITGAAPIAAPAQRAADLRVVVALDAPDDGEIEHYRVWSVARALPSGVVTVFVGTSLESVDEATRTLRRLLTLGVPLLLLVLAGGTWRVVGRALGRVELVRREVDEIGDDDLTRRLQAGPPDEVGRLVTTLNAMLSRVEEGQRSQRDFVADASHELQSPVTALRTQLEVAQAHPEGVDWPALVDDLVEDTDGLQALLQDLLLLARSGAGERLQTPLDLVDLVSGEVSRQTPGPVSLTVRGDAPVPVLGDEAQLARVIRNLVDNAVRHARAAVVVSTGQNEATGWVRVADDGGGVPAEDRDRIFDRFYRVEHARSRAQRGTGLGLAIARSVARSHGGDVVVVPGDGYAGAVFELRVPLDRR